MEPDWERKAANLKPNCAGPHDNSSFVPSGETIVTVRDVLRSDFVLFARFGYTSLCHVRPSNEAALEGVHHRLKSIMRP
jgi:hypothetical protein